MNKVIVTVDNCITIGEIIQNINPAEFGLKARFLKGLNEFVFEGELTDDEFNMMLTGIKMCPLCDLYDVYKNGEKVW